VCDPPVARALDQTREGAEQKVVRVLDHLAHRAVDPLAIGLLVRGGRDRGRIGVRAVELLLQLSLLSLRPATHLVGREVREAEQDETRGKQSHEADDRAHRGLLSAAAFRT
jgi:hypothetical protein